MKKPFISILSLLTLLFMISAAQEKDQLGQSPKQNWDEPPAILKNYPIKYPKDAKEGKIEGAIWFIITIDTKGKVKDIKIEKKDEVTASMIAEAQNAIKHYVFSPAKLKGKAVMSSVTLPIRFKLQ